MNSSIKSVIDSAKDNSTIDMSYIGKNIWVAYIDTDHVFQNLKLVNIPSNITEIKFGNNISKSIISPLVLPPYITTYTGPILDKMEFPDSLNTIEIIETNNNICFSNMKLPLTITSITITPLDSLSTLDSLKLPSGLEVLQINYPFNSCIDNLNLENLQHLKKIILPDSFLQPFNLMKYGLIIEKNDVIVDFPVEFKENSFIEDNVVLNSTPIVNHAIRKYLPSIKNLKIKLDDVIPSIPHVWFNVLLEGKVEVETIIIDSVDNINALKSISLVFNRSNMLKRKVCKNLIINNINFNELMINSYLNLSRSLSRIGNINISLHHTNNINLHGIAKRMASILNMNHFTNGMYSSLFGAIESVIYVKNDTIFIEMGQVHKHFEPPVIIEETTNIPNSSSLLVVPMEDVIGLPPPIKIKLISWSKCIFCKKQEEIIESLKTEINDLDQIIDINVVDDPSEISDKRVTSFPSWVIKDVIEPGVKSKEDIKRLLGTRNENDDDRTTMNDEYLSEI